MPIFTNDDRFRYLSEQAKKELRRRRTEDQIESNEDSETELPAASGNLSPPEGKSPYF